MLWEFQFFEFRRARGGGVGAVAPNFVSICCARLKRTVLTLLMAFDTQRSQQQSHLWHAASVPCANVGTEHLAFGPQCNRWHAASGGCDAELAYDMRFANQSIGRIKLLL